MAKLLITTQILENYGTEDNPYWKAKGGEDYVVKNFRDFNRVSHVVMALRSEIEIDNPLYQEYIAGWEVVDDDYLTQDERLQLLYDGKVSHAPRELTLQIVAWSRDKMTISVPIQLTRVPYGVNIWLQ